MARTLGVRLQFLAVTSLREVNVGLEAAAKARAKGLVPSTDADAIRFASYEELRLGAHERINVMRATADEGKR